MMSVESAFDFFIEEFAIHSQEIFEHAKGKGGKGYFLCFFKSISEMKHATGMQMVFLKHDKSTRKYNEALDNMCKMYDPNKQFVLHLSLQISKESGDCILKTVILDKDIGKKLGLTGGSIRVEENYDVKKIFK